MQAAGKREPVAVRAGIRLFRSVPCPVSSGAGSAAGCSHPFACPPAGARDRMGRVRVRRGGQAGSIKTAPAPALGEGRRGRHKGDLAPGRWPGKAVHAARAGSGARGGEPAGLDRQRICPSRRP
jgi:hypothetical protein